MNKTDLETGTSITDRNGTEGILGQRVNPQGAPEPYWIVEHPVSGRVTTVLERRLLSTDYTDDA